MSMHTSFQYCIHIASSPFSVPVFQCDQISDPFPSFNVSTEYRNGSRDMLRLKTYNIVDPDMLVEACIAVIPMLSLSVNATLTETRQFYTLYNTLEDQKAYMEKEVSSQLHCVIASLFEIPA